LFFGAKLTVFEAKGIQKQLWQAKSQRFLVFFCPEEGTIKNVKKLPS
jgi:hypothetical protein